MARFSLFEEGLRAAMEDSLLRAKLRHGFEARGKAIDSPKWVVLEQMMRDMQLSKADIERVVARVAGDVVLGELMPAEAMQLDWPVLVNAIHAQIDAVALEEAAYRKPVKQTGERVVMRLPPEDDALHREHWLRLAETIRDAGAKVVVVMEEPLYTDYRSAMFTRDPFVKGDKGFYAPMIGNEAMLEERSALLTVMQGMRAQQGLKGYVEGGEVVRLKQQGKPTRLFVGVSHSSAAKARDDRNEVDGKGHLVFWDQKLHDGTLYDQAVKDLHKADGVRVLPLSINDRHAKTFYHLDGALAALPTGQVVVCMEVFNRASQERIKKEVGEENLIRVSREEAEQGATNFITVGSSVITPYASSGLKQKLHGLGYAVIDPQAANLMPGSWMFGTMASVRCATLKVTEDMGFPTTVGGAQQQR